MFWNRVLLALVVGVAAYALALVLAGRFVGDQLFDRLGFGPSDGEIDNGRPYEYVRLLYGVLGAVIVGWMITVGAIVIGPLRKGEPWAWWAIAGALIVWFGLDTSLSLVLGFTGHAAFNLVFAIGLAIPMAVIRLQLRGRPVG